jgi:putative peptidoglycan lipid II flippase
VTDSSGVGRASVLLASGTLVSRILGFTSAIVLAQTIGITEGSNAFALANQLPSNVYAIIAGGLLSSVFVPAIVRAGLHDDGGQRFINKLVTLGIIVFVAAGVIGTALAPALVRLYASIGSSSESDDFIALATTFAYWCLPQILFYALYSLFGEVLNARGVFGPFTWAPAINNVIVIIGLVIFTVLFGTNADLLSAGEWKPGMVALLGGSASLGVAVQAFLLCFFWRRAGLTYRPDFHFRGSGLGTAGKAALWTFGMILVTQIAGVVQSNVAAPAAQTGNGDASYRVLNYTWLIFMLPHSIAAVSIATAYFTRMSTHHRDGRARELVNDLASSLRSIGLIMVFACVGLIVLAYPFSSLFSKRGFTDVATFAPVLIAFLVGLVPFSVLYVLRRTFYAVNDTRTPFFITVFQAVLFVLGALVVTRLPIELIGVGIAVVTTIAGTAQTALAIVLLRRKLGVLHGRAILRRYVQFAVASIPAAAVGVVIVALFGAFRDGGFASSTPVGGAVSMAVAGSVMVAIYGLGLRFMRNPEFSAFVAPILRRLGR